MDHPLIRVRNASAALYLMQAFMEADTFQKRTRAQCVISFTEFDKLRGVVTFKFKAGDIEEKFTSVQHLSSLIEGKYNA